MRKTACQLLIFGLFQLGCSAGATPSLVGQMVEIPAGQFIRGQAGGNDNPQQLLNISNFLISQYEVTLKQFRSFLQEDNPKSYLLDDRYLLQVINKPVGFVIPETWPMYRVNYFESIEFCNWLSRKEGFQEAYSMVYGIGRDKYKDIKIAWNDSANGYRLPTEAEWEYAASAGGNDRIMTTTDPKELSDYAWFSENSDDLPHPIGLKKPNKWGLYDMLGNVSEWCWDYYDVNYYRSSVTKDPKGPIIGNNPENEFGDTKSDRVLRGGDATFYFRWIGVANRAPAPPDTRTFGLTGLRVARNR